MKLTHVTESGEARMVDVSGKDIVCREAVAVGEIRLQPSTIDLVRKNQIQKGDVLAVARVAAIQGAKKTAGLIPLCHNLTLDHVDIRMTFQNDGIEIESRVACHGRTGAEMEALTAVAVAALNIYDMCKAVDHKMVIGNISLKEKSKREVHR
jgi:cyclic pyranopterin phosphate synthase